MPLVKMSGSGGRPQAATNRRWQQAIVNGDDRRPQAATKATMELSVKKEIISIGKEGKKMVYKGEKGVLVRLSSSSSIIRKLGSITRQAAHGAGSGANAGSQRGLGIAGRARTRMRDSRVDADKGSEVKSREDAKGRHGRGDEPLDKIVFGVMSRARARLLSLTRSLLRLNGLRWCMGPFAALQGHILRGYNGNLKSRLPGSVKPVDQTAFPPLTSFSSLLSSTLIGSDPCSRFMNSSASRLGLIAGFRLSFPEDFPSPLNDADAASIPGNANGGAGVNAGEAALPPMLASGLNPSPPSPPHRSAIPDLIILHPSEQKKQQNKSKRQEPKCPTPVPL
ncbi:hypothetical protein IEQ34_026573 [Dendrobium chrysotoxum]|uniref:Uncharacterized protein n=1 Tax=Dendrobium chrysotoxum TaxID=161865 RepID=A0AAV7FL82_DENCH|nr:hypothetical protein IEQ34_026573 [Dendrobium chrysotoxum]